MTTHTQKQKGGPQLRAAEEWLLTALADKQEHLQQQVVDEAAEAGIAAKTLRRAKEKLADEGRLQSRKRRKDEEHPAQWVWRLLPAPDEGTGGDGFDDLLNGLDDLLG